MTKGRKIVGIWPADDFAVSNGDRSADAQPVMELQAESTPAANAPDPSVDNDALWLTLDDPAPHPVRGSRWLMSLGLVASVAWIIFVGWTQSAAFTNLPHLGQWPMIAVMGCAPLVLLLLTSLLFERVSGRSVHRHLDAMTRMREEHHHLSERLSVMDQHWQQAQVTLDSRALSLVDTALQASQRLNDISAALDDRMSRATQEAAAINAQGEAARRSMEALLVALPKIDEVSQRASEAMRESGQLAYQYGSQLEAQIAAVRHESTEAQQALVSVTAQLNERMATVSTGTEAINKASDGMIERLGTGLASGRDAALAMVADLAAALDHTVTASADRLNQARASAAEATGAQIAQLDEALIENADRVSALSSALTQAAQDGKTLNVQLAQTLNGVTARIAAMESLSGEQIKALETQVSSLQQSLDTLDGHSLEATQSTETLVERATAIVAMLVDARREIDTAMPAAIDRLQGLTSTSTDKLAMLPQMIGASNTGMATTLSRMQEAEQSLLAQRAALGELGGILDSMAVRIGQMTGDDASALQAALSRINEQARTIVDSTAGQFEQALSSALDKATGSAVDERLATIADASDQAVKAASAASERLMRQLITIADSSAALEARAAEVTTTIDAGGRETLARQMALLSEAMQSTAVDLVRLLDSDVADQAWEAYLKGDRSIFARRTLRLLHATEAKALLRRYEEEEEFRALVNRYVHDFETMLRGIMDTRDGQQLSVTLLSSDIGKTYVALAQAIERLRG